MPTIYLESDRGLTPVETSPASMRIIEQCKAQGRSVIPLRNKQGQVFEVDARKVHLCELYARIAWYARKTLSKHS